MWRDSHEPPTTIKSLESWAKAKGIKAVVWTNLTHKFDKETEPRTVKQIAEYLADLSGKARARAERYVRCAPPNQQ